MKTYNLTAYTLILLVGTFVTAATAKAQSFSEAYTQEMDSIFAEAIPEYHVVNQGIIRGGRPQKGDLEFLKKQGVRTIINIDDVDTTGEREEANRLGIRFIGSPMSSFKKPKDEQVDKILAQLQDKSLMPIFIHCKHGQDRTGMIMGLYRFRVDKWSSKKAYAEMKQYGFHPILFPLDRYFKKKTGYSN